MLLIVQCELRTLLMDMEALAVPSAFKEKLRFMDELISGTLIVTSDCIIF